MPVAKISSKSQIVIPARIRELLGVGPGDLVELVEDRGRVVLSKAPRSFVEALDRLGCDLWHDYGLKLERERDEWDG